MLLWVRNGTRRRGAQGQLEGRAGRDMERAEVPLGGLEGAGAGLEELVG